MQNYQKLQLFDMVSKTPKLCNSQLERENNNYLSPRTMTAQPSCITIV
jgi:hypothetical protein